MNAEQKFKLARTAIISVALVSTIVLLMFMVLMHQPKTLSTSMDLHNQKIELNCTFASEEKEETTSYGGSN